ncbi:hypothetical protein MAPG_10140, partial [Magnaporthiopsis poae ATCC 64411]
RRLDTKTGGRNGKKKVGATYRKARNAKLPTLPTSKPEKRAQLVTLLERARQNHLDPACPSGARNLDVRVQVPGGQAGDVGVAELGGALEDPRGVLGHDLRQHLPEASPGRVAGGVSEEGEGDEPAGQVGHDDGGHDDEPPAAARREHQHRGRHGRPGARVELRHRLVDHGPSQGRQCRLERHAGTVGGVEQVQEQDLVLDVRHQEGRR